ncbi:hypothetical protein [Clostridium tyrobutyricum]|uniref:hypothetical protein n=1 Tax=Clostridium tyrobutyricum TaxID=1519 RepID=UPI0011C80ED8|nr:hypothetical protein [Clostridium tyrobutyricum]
MSNPQVKFQTSKGIVGTLTNDINTFLSATPGIYYTSHEIDSLITSTAYNTLKKLLVSYGNSGFAEPSSHIGSLCSHLAKQGLLKHSQKYCPYLHKIEDAFAI